MKNKKNNLKKHYLKTSTLLISLFLVISYFTLSLFEYVEYKKIVQKTSENLLNAKKDKLRSKTLEYVNHIEYEKQELEKNLRETLKQRVYSMSDTIDNFLADNKNNLSKKDSDDH